jgi:hypothetical protein
MKEIFNIIEEVEITLNIMKENGMMNQKEQCEKSSTLHNLTYRCNAVYADSNNLVIEKTIEHYKDQVLRFKQYSLHEDTNYDISKELLKFSNWMQTLRPNHN